MNLAEKRACTARVSRLVAGISSPSWLSLLLAFQLISGLLACIATLGVTYGIDKTSFAVLESKELVSAVVTI